MSVKTHREITSDYVDTTKIASDSVKTLAYFSLGAIWIFREQSAQSAAIPQMLLVGGALIILAILLDVIQQFLSSQIALKYLSAARKAKPTELLPEDAAVTVPDWYDKPSVLAYQLKVVSLFTGGMTLFIFLVRLFLK